MIAGCIDRMASDGCDGCERRDACQELFAGLFGNSASWRRPAGRPQPRPPMRSLFFSVLGEVARNVERGYAARQAARTAAAAPTDAEAVPAPKRAAEPGPFRQQVERHLEALLGEGPVGIDKVARALGYSRQTLYRRLKAEGATFEEVLDGLRKRLALRLLREERLPVKEVAWRLGFSDPAAFSRAFKRWTGASPTAGRRDN